MRKRLLIGTAATVVALVMMALVFRQEKGTRFRFLVGAVPVQTGWTWDTNGDWRVDRYQLRANFKELCQLAEREMPNTDWFSPRILRTGSSREWKHVDTGESVRVLWGRFDPEREVDIIDWPKPGNCLVIRYVKQPIAWRRTLRNLGIQRP